MKINDVKQEKEKIVCMVSLEDKEWAEIIKQEKLKAAKNVKIPGFRKGKVPEKEALKHVNTQAILIDAANKAISKAVHELENSEELKKIDKEVYPVPTIDIEKEFDENHFDFEVVYWLMPKISIDDYKKLKVDIKKVEVKDEDVKREIDAILSKEKMLSKKESKTIEKGDQANFDFTGFIDGKEFAGGKAEKFDLEIGSGQFIPGFEDQMIGMKEGEEKEIKVTFPKDYHVADKANKEATFKVKINEVFTVTKPELDEKIIASLNLPDKDIKTPEQFKKFLKENMENYFKQQAYETNLPIINKAIFEHSKYDSIPEVMVEDEIKEIKKQLENRIKQMGMKFEDFLKFTNKSQDDINNELKQQALQNCVVYGALDDIIEKEKIKISDKELDERLALIAKSYNKTVDEVKKIINVETLRESLLHEEALLKLIDWNSK